MLIFWKQRLVFLATPKAGSTAIEAALEPLAAAALKRPEPLKHMTARDFRRYLSPYLEAQTGRRFDAVALMREPISWLRSWRRFRLAARDDHDAPAAPRQGFDAFVQSFLEAPDRLGIGAQTDILCDEAGAALPDRIFAYEKMDQFVHFLEDRLDCAITLPRVNVPPATTGGALSPETEARLRREMAADFALYGRLD